MRIPMLILALLVLSPAVAMAQPEFTSPAEDTTYSKTSSVGFTGSNATASAWYKVQIIKAGTVRQEVVIRADANGNFGGTLHAPAGGWPGGEAALKLFEGTTEKDSVDIQFMPGGFSGGGGHPTGGH